MSMEGHAAKMRKLGSCCMLVVLATAFSTGCGGGQTAPVDGRVKFKDGGDASVLAGYEVDFQPAGGKTSATGQIAADGTFKLTTFGADDGAIPGQHRVAITPPQSADPDKPPQKSKLPAKYSSFDTSELTVEIKPGRNRIELELERAP
jgi:hypothetical protein